MAESEADENLIGDKNDFCQNTLDLQKCLNSVVERVLHSMTNEKFINIYKKCYGEFKKREEIEKPSLSGSSAEAKKYLSQFNSMVTKTTFETISHTLMTLNQNLRELEELKQEHSGNTVVWRPPGNVSKHMMPFEYLCEIEKKKELETVIKKEKETISLLKSRLLQKRIKAEESHNAILSSIASAKNLVTDKYTIDQIES